jgi:hypothetical protein
MGRLPLRLGKKRRVGRHGADLESRLVWILGGPRSGSTWLLALLRASPRVVGIDEPWIGAHIALSMTSAIGVRPHRVPPGAFRLNDMRAETTDYFFSRRYEPVWRPLLRDLILGRLEAQVADVSRETGVRDPVCVIKEPNGSLASDIVMATLPRSRMIFLLRDGRDVIDSELDGLRAGAWARSHAEGYETSDEARLGLLRLWAHGWLHGTLATQRAYESHPPELRMMLRYEDLLEDTDGHLASLDEWLDLGMGPDRIRETVARTRYASLRPEDKGPGRFARAASPGLWRENLSPEEQATLDEIIGPKLREVGYS